ncbi:MAG: hypothetical protein QXS54_05840 [Candidatus Methanomethylicaceae archaeon]
MDLITLGLLSAIGGLAYVRARRYQNESKAKKALSDPGRVQGMTITTKPDGNTEVREDPGAKARAAVALSVQAGQASPNDLVGKSLPDGSEIMSVKRDMWGNAQAVIKRPDGSFVVSVPVYTNGSVKYYEMPVPDEAIIRMPDEIGGVKLPRIDPYISMGVFFKSLDIKKLINEIGVGATGRLSAAIQEYNQQWYDKHRDTNLSSATLHRAHLKAKNIDPQLAMKILPNALATEIKSSLEAAANALASAKVWAEHVGGDEAFNREKEVHMKDIANRELQRVAILAETLKLLGITDISGANINLENAREIESRINNIYPEGLRAKIEAHNNLAREVSSMLSSAGNRASQLTGLPGVTNSERMFQLVLERSGGDPSKFSQVLRETLEMILKAYPSASSSYLNSLEEAAQYSEYARKALEKIKSDPSLNAKYEEYKKALSQVKPEYVGRLGTPIELTTGAVLGQLSKAGVDRETLKYLRERFNLDSGNIKGIYEYAKSRFEAVGRDMSALEPWERAVLGIYGARLPIEVVREMVIVAAPGASVGQGAVYRASQAKVTGVQPPPAKSPADQQIIKDIDSWIKGGMSDADIIRKMDQWVKGGSGTYTGIGTGAGTRTVARAPVQSTPAQSPADQQIVRDIDSWVKGGMSDADIIRRIDQWVKTGK